MFSIPEKTPHGFLVPSLVKKWKAVHSGVKESKDAYDSICEVTSPENQEAWLEIEHEAQARRWEDKTAMDVYDVCADKGKPLFYSGEQFTYWQLRTNCSKHSAGLDTAGRDKWCCNWQYFLVSKWYQTPISSVCLFHSLPYTSAI